MKSYKDLNVWKESRKLVVQTYDYSNSFPKDERFGLTNQIRRAVVSVPSNLAEGFARQSKKEKIQFMYTALGSLAEVEAQSIVALDLKYTTSKQQQNLQQQINISGKLLNGLIRSLKKYD